MARSGWIKAETPERLSDHVSLGVLTRAFPPDVVDRVIARAGAGQARNRLLPVAAGGLLRDGDGVVRGWLL